MKNKIKMILVAVLILSLLILVIFSGGGKKEDEEKLAEEREKIEVDLTLEKIKNLPTTERKERISDETGAKYVSPTKDEFEEIVAIDEIMNNSPIETENFTVYYDYKEDFITVDFTDKENEGNLEIFEDWKDEEGYNVIGDKYWKVNL